jgi:hypothetical protein
LTNAPTSGSRDVPLLDNDGDLQSADNFSNRGLARSTAVKSPAEIDGKERSVIFQSEGFTTFNLERKVERQPEDECADVFELLRDCVEFE